MIRVGVVGVGYWGPNLVRTLNDVEGVQVLRVADMEAGRRDFIGRRFPSVETASLASDVIGDSSIDAVFIATPPATHYRLAIEALSAGKHVFIEKPFTTTLADAEDVVRLGESLNKRVGIGHLFLYHPAVRKIQDLLTAGDLGAPLFICSSRFNVGPPRTKVDVLWDLAPHDVSIVLHLLGESPVKVTASGARFNDQKFVEAAFVNLAFPSGRMAQVNVGWLTPNKVRNLMLVCDSKTVVYDDMQAAEKIRIFQAAHDNRRSGQASSESLAYGPGAIVIPPVPSSEPLRLECEDFINSIRNGTEPVSNGRRAIEVVRVLEAASELIYSQPAPKHEVAAI